MSVDKKMIMRGMYNGCSTTKAGLSTIHFKFPVNQIGKYIQCHYYIGMNLFLETKVDGVKTSIGIVRIKSLKCDREGESTISLEGENVDLTEVLSMIERNVIICISPTGGSDHDE